MTQRTTTPGPPPSLVVMAKAPELGCVKTRLAAHVGAEVALAVYHELLTITAAAANAWPGPVVVASTGDRAAFAPRLFAKATFTAQPAGGLGGRIAHALRTGLQHAPATIVIGSDCPRVDRAQLANVTALLAHEAVAFGPARDGGFWSIAARDARAAVVVEVAAVPWSQPATLTTLRAALLAAGLGSCLGPELDDVDTEPDLRRAIAAGDLRGPWPLRGAP